MNKCIFMGVLCADPEVKATTKGTNITKFRLAVRRTSRNAEGKYESDYVSCVAFGKTGEMIARHFLKGHKILVEATAHSSSYEKGGVKVYSTDFNVETFYFTEPFGSNLAETTPNEVFSPNNIVGTSVGLEDEMPF